MDTLPVASSSDEQRSFWASNVEHTLLIMREELERKEDNVLQILKVPDYTRHPTTDYTPVEWRFGLHNRDENLDMSDAEAAKRAVMVLFGLDEQSKWTTFCNVVVPDPKAMQKCYGLHKEVNGLLEAKIKHVLAFDALFLALQMELFDSLPSESRKFVRHIIMQSPAMWDTYIDTFRRSCDMVFLDLCKIENQIPFDLIKRAMNHVTDLTNSGQVNIGARGDSTDSEFREKVSDEYLERSMKAAVDVGLDDFMDVSDFYADAKATQKLSDSHHILDAAYKVICGVDGMKRKADYDQKVYIHVPSAMRLKESGIRIEGVAGPLCDMLYDKKKKCLYVPKMRLFDSTVSVVRNMARYEDYSKDDKCLFHDYVILMLDLIQTPLDLNHLVKCGVIYNSCGIEAVDMWRAVANGLNLIRSSKEHNKLKVGIKERCRLRRHRLWSEFRELFLSRPWLTLSAVAITLVTLATLIQTYVAVIGSNGMKPQFKP